MKSQSSEAQQYFKYCLTHPYSALDLSWYVFNRVRLRLRDRAHAFLGGSGKLHHYPREIRRLARRVLPQTVPNDAWFALLPPTGWSPAAGPALDGWSPPLATHSLSLSDLDWHKSEDDLEDLFALHRFTWLMRWLALRPCEQSLRTADDLILDWIDRVGPRKDLPVWETYSAAERVVNWLFYLCATKGARTLDANTAAIILRALHEHLIHISRGLEYYGEAFNNHILNDARALYIGGRFLGLPAVAELGAALFQRHTPELIDQQGALIEDSTHYQLLLTRTFTEVLWAARTTAHDSFVGFLEPVVRSMVECCLSIGRPVRGALEDSFPRIGDISPDFPVAWFYPNREQADCAGNWDSLWKPSIVDPMIGEAALEQNPAEWRWVADPSDTYRIFLHTPRNARTYPRGHGHLDFGSFMLYDAGGPLIVDRGRCSYRADEIGSYGFSGRAHNTTLINGQPLLPNSNGLYRGYRPLLDQGMPVQIESEEQGLKLRWETTAIKRIGASLAWSRSLLLTAEGMDIFEEISNSEGIDLMVESYIHWAAGWTIQPDLDKSGPAGRSVVVKGRRSYCLEIRHSGDDFSADWFSADDASLDGWHFPEYGQKIRALTLRLSFRTSRDLDFQLRIRPL